MKLFIAVLCLAFAATGAFAQDKKDRKKFHGFPRDVVEVETFQFEGCLC